MIIVEGISHVNIGVTDLEVSSKFYADIFDFEVIDDKDSNSVTMTLDPIKIKLIKLDKVQNQLSSMSFPTLSFILDVDDFTEAISELEEKSIKIVKGPEGIEDGECLYFKDPDNNLIEIFYKG